MRMKALALATLAALATAVPAPSSAQQWPDKPVRGRATLARGRRAQPQDCAVPLRRLKPVISTSLPQSQRQRHRRR